MEPKTTLPKNNPNYIMKQNNPSCIACYEKFNPHDILPILFECGHTAVCKNCYYKLDKM